MKLKVKNSAQHSSNLIVPFDGLVTIDEKGEFEVSEKCGKFLLVQTENYESAEVTSGGSGNGSNAGNGGETDENQLIMDGLKDISLEEAVKLAQESGYPEEEYQKFAKKQKLMAAYLIKKFKESIATKTAEVKAEDADTSKVDETKVDVDDQSGDQVQ